MAKTKKQHVKSLSEEEKLGLLKKAILAKIAKKNLTEAQLQAGLNKLKRLPKKIGTIDHRIMSIALENLREAKQITVVDLITIYAPNVMTREVEGYMPIYGPASETDNVSLKQKVKMALDEASPDYGMNVPELQEKTKEPNDLKVLHALAELGAYFAPTQRTHGRDPDTGCPYPFYVSYTLPEKVGQRS